jgi:hypothetical protein
MRRGMSPSMPTTAACIWSCRPSISTIAPIRHLTDCKEAGGVRLKIATAEAGHLKRRHRGHALRRAADASEKIILRHVPRAIHSCSRDRATKHCIADNYDHWPPTA